jgi:hypothetical protein
MIKKRNNKKTYDKAYVFICLMSFVVPFVLSILLVLQHTGQDHIQSFYRECPLSYNPYCTCDSEDDGQSLKLQINPQANTGHHNHDHTNVDCFACALLKSTADLIRCFVLANHNIMFNHFLTTGLNYPSLLSSIFIYNSPVHFNDRMNH